MLGPKLAKRSLLFPLVRTRYSLQELSPRSFNLVLVQVDRIWHSLATTYFEEYRSRRKGQRKAGIVRDDGFLSRTRARELAGWLADSKFAMAGWL